jgi:siroheme synthase-like protein
MAPDALMPLFHKLRGRKVVVVGAGRVALAKLAQLEAAGAAVTVVAPVVLPDFRAHRVALVERPFVPGDLDGAWLAVAAATPPVNRAVAAACEVRRVFVNVVDDLEAASAYMGAVVRRDGAVLAISTEGRAPALAGLLREALEALLPADLDRWIAESRRLREGWRARAEPMARRRPLLLEALNRLYAP